MSDTSSTESPNSVQETNNKEITEINDTNTTPRSSASHIENNDQIFTLESLKKLYKNRLVSFSTSPANSELISKFYKKQHNRNNAEIIKLNSLTDYGLLRFRPTESTREYVVLGHILCTHSGCQSKLNGPFTLVFEGGNKKGGDLRTTDSIELESAKCLESGFDAAYDEAWLKKIQFEKSPFYETPKTKVRKGGTKAQHTLTHSPSTTITPEPAEKVSAANSTPISTTSSTPSTANSSTPNSTSNSTPDYLIPDPRGSKFSRSVGVTSHHRKMVGFKQVLMQLDTHCSMKSQDSYYLRDWAKIIADTSSATGVPGDELVYGHSASKKNLLQMSDMTDQHHADLIRQAQNPYGSHFVQYSSDQTRVESSTPQHNYSTATAVDIFS